MTYTKHFATCALALGLLCAGRRTASAQEGRYQYQVQDQYGNPYDRSDYGNGFNSPYAYSNTYDRIEELQEHIAHDHARLDEAIRCGNDTEAARQAADLARDQRALRDLQYGQNARYSAVPRYYAVPSYDRGWSFHFGWR